MSKPDEVDIPLVYHPWWINQWWTMTLLPVCKVFYHRALKTQRRVAWKGKVGKRTSSRNQHSGLVCLLSQICGNVSAHAALSLYFLLVYDCTPQCFEALWWDATLLRRCWNLWAKHIRWTRESFVFTLKFLLTQRQRRHELCLYNCLICSSSRNKWQQ